MQNRIKQIRETLKLKQKEFGEPLGIGLTHISKYERGEVKPTSDILEKLANIYQINLNWLLTGNGQMFLEEQKQPQEDCICKEREKMLAAFDKLPRERQEYYHYKIIAEALN